MSRRWTALAVLVAVVAAGIVAAVLIRGGSDDGAAPPAAFTAPSRPSAASPVSVAVPQPVSLGVEARLWALRAGQEPWPLQGSRGYIPVGWSPDGSYLLAERRVAPRALAAFPIGGNTAPRPVSDGLDRAAWSPDGRWIAARYGGDLALLRVGGPLRRVAAAPTGAGPVAAWSADSARIAWASGAAVEVAAFPAGAPERLTLDAGPVPTSLAWSPDGTRIALARGGDVLVLPTAGGPARRVAAGTAPAWSPDGTHLAYATGTRTGVAPLEGGAPRLFAGCDCDLPGAAPAVAWSQDGTRILRVAERGDTLVSTRPDGGDPTTVVRVRGLAIQRPMWVPGPR